MFPVRKYNLLAVTGPTATGKTALAARLALELDGEVISADSRQVYRGMDLGTGKDYGDYRVGDREVPFHLIDIVDAGESYNLFRYQQDFARVFRELQGRGTFPVLCGGSGMYLEAVLRGYQLAAVPVDHSFRESLKGKGMEELTAMLAAYKKLHNITDIDTRPRLLRALEIARYQDQHPEPEPMPVIRPLVVGIEIDRQTRRQRITERLSKRLEAGMIDEVRMLMEQGVSEDQLVYYGLEYKYIAFFLNGSLSREEMFSRLETAIHRFAKRQMTWFRGMEKRGIPIRWLDFSLPMEGKIRQVMKWIGEG